MMSADFSQQAENTVGIRTMESKAPTAFRTISEVANNLEVPQHVLRFWESKFQQVRPLKRGGGRRYYRPEDVALLSNIKELLYNQGLTIRGVQKLLRESGRGGIVRPSAVSAEAASQLRTDGSVETAASAAVSSAPVITQTPTVAALMGKPDAVMLSMAARREVETVLSELKTMRELLRQSGV